MLNCNIAARINTAKCMAANVFHELVNLMAQPVLYYLAPSQP